jgi:outer membrane protein
MQPFVTRLLATFVIATALTGTAAADSSIGVVNTQKIMRDSKAAQSVRSQLQSKQKAFQSELDAKEKQLLSEDQALVKQRSTMEQAAFEQKVKDFRAKAAVAQREVQAKKLQVDKALASSLESIQETVLEIVKEVAAEKKMTTVLSAGQVLYAEPALDITDEVLNRLNKKLPNVAVKF